MKRMLLESGDWLDEIMEAVSYPLLEELPEYVPDDNAAGRMKLTVSQLKAMQAMMIQRKMLTWMNL